MFKIVEVVNVRVQAELVDLLGLIQNEVGGQQAEVAELVAQGLIAPTSELKNQPTKATPWHKHAYTIACFFIVGWTVQLILEVGIDLSYEWVHALSPFSGSQT